MLHKACDLNAGAMIAREMQESPSLVPAGAGSAPAFELKFLLSEQLAAEVEAWARPRLAMDAHGDPDLGGAYRTTSLYCDTPELDVYYRSPSYKRRKYRVRRYGSAAWLFLERKARTGDRVAKRRTAIALDDLSPLAQPLAVTDWPGYWFHRRLLTRRLGPACRVSYERIAYVGTCAEGPLRLTLDRQLHGELIDDWSFDPRGGDLPLLTGQVVLELKFRAALPHPFRELLQELRLSPCPVSKYRLCRQAWGVTSERREAASTRETGLPRETGVPREVAYA